MKKVRKTLLLWGCGALGTLVILFNLTLLYIGSILFIISSYDVDRKIANDPEEIAEKADFDLPDYVVVSRTDNMDRQSSAWSAYTWEVRLKEPLSADDLEDLQELVEDDTCWTYNAAKNTYHYFKGAGLDESTEVTVDVQIHKDKTTVTLDYCWWDMEW